MIVMQTKPLSFIVQIILTLGAIFLPVAIQIQGTSIAIVFLFWVYINSIKAIIDPLFIYLLLPLLFLRLSFVHRIGKYYSLGIDRRRVLLIGVLIELPIGLFTGIMILIWLFNPMMIMTLYPAGFIPLIPIPLLLLISSLFLWVTPRHERELEWPGDTRDKICK